MCFCIAENSSSVVDLLVPAAVLGRKNTGLQASTSFLSERSLRSIIQHAARFLKLSRVWFAENSLSTLFWALLVCGGFLLWVVGRRPGRDTSTGLKFPFRMKGLSAVLSKHAARFLVWTRVWLAESSLSLPSCASLVYVGSMCWLLAAVQGGVEIRGLLVLWTQGPQFWEYTQPCLETERESKSE